MSSQTEAPGRVDMDGVYAKAMEIVDEANALLLVALHGAIETELQRREAKLDTNEDAKIRSGQELRKVREFVRDLDDSSE